MNGAQALLHTLIDAGVRVCFSNPGTSEMHFVAALDAAPQMRAVLCLFEGVATGAADGYARMSGQPAATLLHLGCGLGNGLANLHNARKAKVPLLNLVGDHARWHAPLDAPLQSDIETIARNVSPGFVRTSASSASLCRDALDALQAAQGPPGQVATLILPADVCWGEGAVPLPPRPPTPPSAADPERLRELAAILRQAGSQAALLLGAGASSEAGLLAAARIAAHTGARLYAETFPARLPRGAGRPLIERIAYLPELAAVQLRGLRHLILVDAKAPVSFFAYPGKRSELAPENCLMHPLCEPTEDARASLEQLCTLLAAEQTEPQRAALAPATLPPDAGRFDAEAVCRITGACLPDNAILIDEAISSGLKLPKYTANAPAHDLLTLTGGAIGQGLPCAIGAAIACPERKVLALIGDGSAMYTIQALWTLARERLDVTAIIFNNAAYAVLELELERVGARADGRQARAQLDLQSPALDFSQLARSLGVPGSRVSSCGGFRSALQQALQQPGPHLIEAMVPPILSGRTLRLLPHLLGSLKTLPRPLARLLARRIA